MKRKLLAVLTATLLTTGIYATAASAQGPVPDFSKIEDKSTVPSVPETTEGEIAVPSAETTENTVPSNSSNASDSKPATVTVKFPEISGEKISDEEALKVLETSAVSLNKLESYDMDMLTAMKILEEDIVTNTKYTVFPKLHESQITVSINGQEVSTYLKDGKIYQMNPQTMEWQFMDIGKGNPPQESVKVDPSVLEFTKVEKLQDGGYVIKITDMMPLEDAMNAFPSENQQSDMTNLKNIMGEDMDMKVRILAVTDKNMVYKSVFYEYDTYMNDENNSVFKTFVQYAYSNINNAAPVVIPEDVLKNAKEIKMEDLQNTEENVPSETPATEEPQQDQQDTDQEPEATEEGLPGTIEE